MEKMWKNKVVSFMTCGLLERRLSGMAYQILTCVCRIRPCNPNNIAYIRWRVRERGGRKMWTEGKSMRKKNCNQIDRITMTCALFDNSFHSVRLFNIFLFVTKSIPKLFSVLFPNPWKTKN